MSPISKSEFGLVESGREGRVACGVQPPPQLLPLPVGETMLQPTGAFAETDEDTDHPLMFFERGPEAGCHQGYPPGLKDCIDDSLYPQVRRQRPVF